MGSRKTRHHFLERRELYGPKVPEVDWEHDEFYQKDVRWHSGCVNSAEFNHTEDLLASGGDDLTTLLWRVTDLLHDHKPKPFAMKTEHTSNVFTHQFSVGSEQLFSGGNDGKVICHDLTTGDGRIFFETAGESVYQLHSNFFNTHLLAVANENGSFILDDRSQDRITFVNDNLCYSIQSCPTLPSLYTVTSRDDGLLFFDLRKPGKFVYNGKSFALYSNFPNGTDFLYTDCKWNEGGTALALVKSLSCPVIIDFIADQSSSVCPQKVELFDNRYKNVHTIKSVEWLSDDIVATGSDDFGVSVWKHKDIPDDMYSHPKPSVTKLLHMKSPRYLRIRSTMRHLEGHRSIVNHVKYSRKNGLLVSNGVERMVKCWSNYSIPGSYKKPYTRVMSDLEPPNRRDDDKEQRELGLATYDDIFGGDEDTAEDTEILKFFDDVVLKTHRLPIHHGSSSDSSDSDEEPIDFGSYDLMCEF